MIKHLKSFLDRLLWMRQFMGGVVPASKFLIKAKGNPDAEGELSVGDIYIKFKNWDSIAIKEVFVDGEYNFLSDYITNCDSPVIFDIGAHIGSFSLWAYSKNKNASLIALEANPETYKTLQQNLQNNIGGEVWSAHNRAAWKNQDDILFEVGGNSVGNKVAKTGGIAVKGMSFFDVLESIDSSENIDLMKVDIEGAEEAFFADVSTDDLKRINRMVIEFHPEYCNVQNLIALLKERYSNVNLISGRIDDKPLYECF